MSERTCVFVCVSMRCVCGVYACTHACTHTPAHAHAHTHTQTQVLASLGPGAWFGEIALQHKTLRTVSLYLSKIEKNRKETLF
jgi:hypothetical protein